MKEQRQADTVDLCNNCLCGRRIDRQVLQALQQAMSAWCKRNS